VVQALFFSEFFMARSDIFSINLLDDFIRLLSLLSLVHADLPHSSNIFSCPILSLDAGKTLKCTGNVTMWPSKGIFGVVMASEEVFLF
jgi:hypothetical protein